MAGTSVSEPRRVVLTEAEWDEIERCSMAFHAALRAGVQDEGTELLRTTGERLSSPDASGGCRKPATPSRRLIICFNGSLVQRLPPLYQNVSQSCTVSG